MPFSYSVTWVPSDIEPSRALATQIRNGLQGAGLIAGQQMDIHWLAIINSFVLMLLIFSLLLLIIVRVVK